MFLFERDREREGLLYCMCSSFIHLFVSSSSRSFPQGLVLFISTRNPNPPLSILGAVWVVAVVGVAKDGWSCWSISIFYAAAVAANPLANHFSSRLQTLDKAAK